MYHIIVTNDNQSEQNFERITKGFLLIALGDDIGDTCSSICMSGVSEIDIATLILGLDSIRKRVTEKIQSRTLYHK